MAEVTGVALYGSLLMFALSGILLVGAVNKYTHAVRLMDETKKLATRVLLSRRR